MTRNKSVSDQKTVLKGGTVSDATLIPISQFRVLFPELCLNGQPKEGVLEPAALRFESYSSNNVGVMGQAKPGYLSSPGSLAQSSWDMPAVTGSN